MPENPIYEQLSMESRAIFSIFSEFIEIFDPVVFFTEVSLHALKRTIAINKGNKVVAFIRLMLVCVICMN